MRLILRLKIVNRHFLHNWPKHGERLPGRLFVLAVGELHNKHWMYLYNSIVRNIAFNNSVCANLDVVADFDAPRKFCTGSDIDIVPDNRKPLFGPCP